MKLAHRLGFYFIGFIIGLFLLLFFLGGKKASCDYSPNARVLKNIRLKKRFLSENALQIMSQNQIDTSYISSVLQSGNVNFGKSNTQLDSCKIYYIEGTLNYKTIELVIENCDSIAKINTLRISN